MINILIPEEFPSLNKGEAAILIGMLESFKALGDEFTVSLFSLSPEIDTPRYTPRVRVLNAWGIMPSALVFRARSKIYKAIEYLTFLVKHLTFLILFHLLGSRATRIMKRDVWKGYCKADIIILGHDGTFADLYHSILIHFFKHLNKLVVIYGATLPFITRSSSWTWKLFYKCLVRSALNQTHLITLRETKSYEHLKKMGIREGIFHFTGDFGYLSPAASDEAVEAIMAKEGLKNCHPLVGMTISRNKIRYTFPEITDARKKRARYIAVMAEVVDYFVTSLGATVVFIPHSIVQNDELRDDSLIASEILQQVREKAKVKVITNEYSAEELKGLAGKFHFCIGTRLHFILDAVSMRIPSIAISNRADYRVHGIIGGMSGQARWVYDVDDLDYNDLKALIDEGWRLRDQTAAELRIAMEQTRKRTLLNGELLRDITAGRGSK